MRKALLLFLTLFTATLVFQYLHQPKQPDLTVVGFIHQKDGLGRQSAELLDAFRKTHNVNFVPTRNKKLKDTPKKYKRLLKGEKDPWGKVIIFEDMLWWPGHDQYKAILSSNRETSIRIAYSMWESNRLPHEWVHILNEHFDAVAVPSTFLLDVYKDSGVQIPIFHIPLGLNLDSFLSQPLKDKPGTPFTFGNLSVCSERKNQVQLIRAFAQAFGNDPSVRLRINCRYGEKEVSAAITKEIAKLQLDNVIFTQFSLSPTEYLELFKTIDCYVSPSKGEGFSIQPREAMALGISVILTDNTGQSDICASNLVQAISSPIEEPAQFPWGNHYGHNYNCSSNDLAQAMLTAKNNYNANLGQREQLRTWATKTTFEEVIPAYTALVQPSQVYFDETCRIEKSTLYVDSSLLKKKYEAVLNGH